MRGHFSLFNGRGKRREKMLFRTKNEDSVKPYKMYQRQKVLFAALNGRLHLWKQDLIATSEASY